jgi:predicted ATPase/DNA-binding CsgD family transcriptional regulator
MSDIPADFPSLKTLDIFLHNLPVQPTRFIGREKEVAAVVYLLCKEDVRLLTLTGTGGTGKTRLGLQVVKELSDRFSDGIYFVDLAPISDPKLVIFTIAFALDLQEVSGQFLLDNLKAFLREKQILLMLDNFEQVAQAAPDVAELLSACPKLKVLVTSRMSLHLQAEQEFAVPPLSLPDIKYSSDLIVLSQYEAVALFIQRARAVQPNFQLTNSNAQAVAEICVRLDGLPLAIELAATRIRLFSPKALLAQLGHRLDLLIRGALDAPARQRTLRDTIAWSYLLLDESEQRLFRKIAVFVGGCTLEAIQAICAEPGDSLSSVLDRVESLIDKNLVRLMAQGEETEPRLVMLETIREYGLEVLDASGEEQPMRQAHAHYYLALVEEKEPHLHGPEQAEWFDRFEQERDNMRASLHWLLERAEDRERIEMALRLGGALWWFWFVRGPVSEGWTVMSQALASSQEVAVTVRAKALWAAGWLAGLSDDHEQAEALCQESLFLFRQIGDTAGVAIASLILGVAELWKSQMTVAHSYFDESLALFRELGDKEYIGWSLHQLAAVALFQGEYTRACLLYEESLALRRQLGNRGGMAFSLSLLARVEVGQGNLTTARILYDESLALYKDEANNTWDNASYLEGLAELVATQGEPAWAARLWGAAEALRETSGAPLAPVYRADYDHDVAAARGLLGEQAFTAALDQGRSMTFDQVITEAGRSAINPLASSEHASKSTIRQANYPDGLTAREVEVLRLVAQGLSNAEIADQLVISLLTVKAHMRSLYNKLGISSRSSATRYAIEHQLV